MVVVFSGSETQQLEEVFGSLPIWLAAENGVFVSAPSSSAHLAGAASAGAEAGKGAAGAAGGERGGAAGTAEHHAETRGEVRGLVGEGEVVEQRDRAAGCA